jgi:hypothetical protein
MSPEQVTIWPAGTAGLFQDDVAGAVVIPDLRPSMSAPTSHPNEGLISGRATCGLNVRLWVSAVDALRHAGGARV